MKLKALAITTIVLLSLLTILPAYARDAARDLRKLIGYTIVSAESVSDVLESSDGSKYLKLSDGSDFKIDYLLLDPLPLTDVIIFAKPFPKDLVEKFRGKIPDSMLYSFKLLMDNEIYDAQPAQ